MDMRGWWRSVGLVTCCALAAGALSLAAVARSAAAQAPTVPPVPTRWPYPIVVTGTPLSLTERAAFRATYAAWWTQTPAAPWPWPTAAVGGTVGATATISPTIDATIERAAGSPAQVPTVLHTPTPEPWPCRFETARCGTRLYAPFGGKSRRR